MRIGRGCHVVTRLAPLGLIIALGLQGVARADAASDAALQKQVQDLQTEIQELKGEINTIKANSVVQAPAAPPAGSTAAAPAPATVGQHVGAIEKDVADIKTNLSTNLGVHIHGLVDVPYEYNLNQPNTSGGSKGGVNSSSPGGSVNQLRVFDTEGSGFNLQQFNLHLDRTSDGGVGFVTELNFGQVANVLRASTRESNINPGTTSNDVIDLTQAYMTYTVPVGSGIALQLGRFVTLLGAEVIPTYSTYGSADYNISRSFIFGFGIPFTHTGLRGTYNFNQFLGLTLGVNNGWDDVTDNNDGQTFEGQLSLSSGDRMTHNQSLALTLSSTYGPEQVNRGSSRRWEIDPVLTYKTPIKGLQLIGEYLYAQETGPVSISPAFNSHGNPLCAVVPGNFCAPAPGFSAGPNGTILHPHAVSWNGADAYIVYDLTDNLEFALRGEYFEDPNGARTGLPQLLGEGTGTINYKIPAVTGLLARLEYRHDESNKKPFFNDTVFGPTSILAGLPNHTRAGQDTFIADAIYSF
ncbi:MAG TPA: outer membrane beta-barrel protein [Candidatus Binataceae bacterium]|nr:outer membrane beta-barrel protein [Candidatus Binataceae bacterium]